jgi:hypothetical protein
MMNKTFENMQQLSKEWGAYSRRVSRDALRAMSGQLENAARYLGSLSHRLDADVAHGETATNGEAHEPTPNGHADEPGANEHAN